MKSPGWFRRMTRAQLGWALFGLIVLGGVIALGSGDIYKIYKADESFVAGSMLAFTGFCFGRAFSRRGIDDARAMVHQGERSELAEELAEEFARRLNARQAFPELREARLHIAAEVRKATENYDALAKDPRSYEQVTEIRNRLINLDRSLAALVRLELAMTSGAGSSYVFDPGDVSHLEAAQRDTREAVQRGLDAFVPLSELVPYTTADALWGAFSVLWSDTLKALRDVESLMVGCFAHPPLGALVTVRGYLSAALARSEELQMIIKERQLQIPPALQTMNTDLANALHRLQDVGLGRLPAGG
ncbi:hypothetical protein [Nonomuraea soli]|uniref:Uncharacterized protein n=1 Tax=Nonomuraea soli TaxID=1032476 RepID=A0A7W0CET4_9ACTN|nr:hypothetical protein [Nonomuraea soli]MBA2889819.1 hypothetical protein [Nonomuraea soli]